MKTIIHVADLAAPRERVFAVLTTVAGLAAWWTTKVEGDAGRGGQRRPRSARSWISPSAVTSTLR